jgi:hypothetical protein
MTRFKIQNRCTGVQNGPENSVRDAGEERSEHPVRGRLPAGTHSVPVGIQHLHRRSETHSSGTPCSAPGNCFRQLGISSTLHAADWFRFCRHCALLGQEQRWGTEGPLCFPGPASRLVNPGCLYVKTTDIKYPLLYPRKPKILLTNKNSFERSKSRLLRLHLTFDTEMSRVTLNSLLCKRNLICVTEKAHLWHKSLPCDAEMSLVTLNSHLCHWKMSLVSLRNVSCATEKCLLCHWEMSLVPLRNVSCATEKCHLLHWDVTCDTEMSLQIYICDTEIFLVTRKSYFWPRYLTFNFKIVSLTRISHLWPWSLIFF